MGKDNFLWCNMINLTPEVTFPIKKSYAIVPFSILNIMIKEIGEMLNKFFYLRQRNI
jgi:hypothetical protein